MEQYVNQLVADIARYAQAYYQGTPLISDAEFDQLVEKLKVIDPQNTILSTPGWGYVPAGVKFKHITTIGSLDKIKIDSEQAKSNIISKYPNSDWIYTPKLDGGSAVAYYENGKLVKIISRGNGDEGVDITLNVLKGNSVPVELPKLFHEIKAVRGEVIISKSDFKEYLSQNYANARNASTGISQSIDSPNCKYLKFVVYDIIQSDNGVNDYRDQLTYLYDAGFITVPCLTINTVEDFDKYSPANTDYDYDVDGIVICNNKVQVNESGVSIYNALALKYEAESALTKVTGIEWCTTRLGKLSPVICFEPVELSGAVISRCSGFNALSIKNGKVGTGAIIKVCRSNEVIPHWLETIESVEPDLPDEWEGQKTFWNGVDLCIKVDNTKNVISNLISWSLEFGCGGVFREDLIRNFELTSFDKLVEVCNTKSLESNKESILDRFGPVYGKTIYKVLWNVFHTPRSLDQLLVIANLRGLGDVAADEIAKCCDLNGLIDILEKYNGLSPEIACKLPTYVPEESIKENCEFLLRFLKLPHTSKKFIEASNEGKIRIALTGKLSKTRGELLKDWAKFGVIESDIGQADYLVTDNPNSGSSKNKKADSLGIKKVTEQEFINIINGN